MAAMSVPARTSSLAAEAATLFRQYRDGQTRKMSDLVTLLTPALWGVARSCGLSTSQAEDVVQNSWVSLVQKTGEVRDPQAVLGWLLTTTRREAWRVSGRPSPAPLDDDTASSAPGPETTVEDQDMRQRLWRHVTSLSPRCQALLRVVAYASPPDYATISAALQMPVGSIGPTRGRCLAALRKALTSDPSWSL